MILLYRRYFANPLPVPAKNPGYPCLGRPNETYNRILRYMEDHINEQLTIETICKNTLVSRSRLQKLFQELHGCGVIEFFTLMKIDTAKELIRSNQLNFTQIADRLGYTSIHYFSRQFKKVTHMNPSSCGEPLSQKRSAKRGAECILRIVSCIFFHNLFQLGPFFFHIGNQGQLSTAPVQIMAFSAGVEVHISLKIICEKTHTAL